MTCNVTDFSLMEKWWFLLFFQWKLFQESKEQDLDRVSGALCRGYGNENLSEPVKNIKGKEPLRMKFGTRWTPNRDEHFLRE